MRSTPRTKWLLPALWCALLCASLAVGLAGCGTPGAPQPPSLHLPETVKDLAAVRTGNTVTLTWTMPRRNTDKLLLKDPVEVRVCRSVEASACEPAAAAGKKDPSIEQSWSEALPPAMSAGQPRVVRYYVELVNDRGRSAGRSNAALILAGAAPGPIPSLTGELRKGAVALHWNAEEGDASVRLMRTLLTRHEHKKEGLMTAEPQPEEMRMLVAGGSRAGGGLDAQVEVGDSYQYRAQRVATVQADGKTLELDGEFSAPFRIDVKDIFPPEKPQGLAAVASKSDAGELSIDLSWQANTDTDLAGYVVYRREADGDWAKISPAAPVVGGAYHDATVQAGRTYRYAVSAVDSSGHESERSDDAEESVPNS